MGGTPKYDTFRFTEYASLRLTLALPLATHNFHLGTTFWLIWRSARLIFKLERRRARSFLAGGAPILARAMPPHRLKGGAFQPAGRRGAASPRGRLPTVQLRLGCFNCGMDQKMLTKEKWLAKLRRVIGFGVIEGGFHLLTLCEVGGHGRGLSKSPHANAQSLVRQVFDRPFQAISEGAYMATWLGEPGPDDDTSLTLTLTGRPKVVQLDVDGNPQLVMMVFTIAHRNHPGKQGILISGQLHIRTPSGKMKSIERDKKKGGGPSAAALG